MAEPWTTAPRVPASMSRWSRRSAKEKSSWKGRVCSCFFFSGSGDGFVESEGSAIVVEEELSGLADLGGIRKFFVEWGVGERGRGDIYESFESGVWSLAR